MQTRAPDPAGTMRKLVVIALLACAWGQEPETLGRWLLHFREAPAYAGNHHYAEAVEELHAALPPSKRAGDPHMLAIVRILCGFHKHQRGRHTGTRLDRIVALSALMVSGGGVGDGSIG
jgi:hypothetical protein